MKLVIASAALLALSASSWIAGTNSRAATQRGLDAWAKGDYAAAVEAFAEADRLKPGPETALNRGTAEIAAGQTAAGIEHLSPVVGTGELGERALFNRGTGALIAGDAQRAIPDLIEYLRRHPADAAAKKNLELALRRADEQSRQQQSQQQRQQRQRQRENQEGSSAAQQQKDGDRQKPGSVDAESLLRSVAQQEREELSRMRRAGRERNTVGW